MSPYRLILLSLLAVGPRAAPAETVRATIGLDPNLKAGMDGSGNVLLYAPDPFESGSSISHWDRSAFPDLLMEPSISPTLAGGEVDLTTAQLRDLGWSTLGGVRIELHFADSPGQGFFQGRTGSARRSALRTAADIWEGLLGSTETIHVNAQFEELECGDDGAVLAQAGSRFAFQLDVAPFPGTWYHGALAEALSGSNLSTQSDPDPEGADILVTFNSRIDDACLGSENVFYYGLDGNAPSGQISFLNVALHEIAHGLGFSNFIDEETGRHFFGSPDIYSQFTLDALSGRHWSELSAAEIRASALNGPHVAWDGPQVRAAAPQRLAQSPSVLVLAPEVIAGSYRVSTAVFGPSPADVEVTGDIVLFDDGTADPTLACSPPINASDLRGRIALVDRGECNFVDKTRHAQQAGAIGVIVANNVSGLVTMGGSDPSLTVPTVMVSRVDGATLKDALAGKLGEEEEEEEEEEREEPSLCVELPTNLCLNGGRFRVEVDWRRADGAGGRGMARELTQDTGYFWFFSETNVELVVKVLDGCADFDRFWVFAGGLTNVEVELEVVDTATGTIRRYRNPLGTPFAPIQDTQAFATCP